jgi:hypothetical protein
MPVASSSRAETGFRAVLALVLACCLGVCAARAAERDIRLAGVKVSGETTLDGRTLLLNGAGVRTLFGFRVYVAALYLPYPMRAAEQILDSNTPRRLRLTLLRDTSTDQNLSALREGLVDNNSAAEMAAIHTDVARFFSLIQQVSEVPTGTVIQLDYLPGAGTWVRIGDRNLGMVPGERFNRAILKIWLGGDPIQTSLKHSLLGLGEAGS